VSQAKLPSSSELKDSFLEDVVQYLLDTNSPLNIVSKPSFWKLARRCNGPTSRRSLSSFIKRQYEVLIAVASFFCLKLTLFGEECIQTLTKELAEVASLAFQRTVSHMVIVVGFVSSDWKYQVRCLGLAKFEAQTNAQVLVAKHDQVFEVRSIYTVMRYQLTIDDTIELAPIKLN